MQVFVPSLSESYVSWLSPSLNPFPKEAHFPNSFQHCVSWASDSLFFRTKSFEGPEL